MAGLSSSRHRKKDCWKIQTKHICIIFFLKKNKPYFFSLKHFIRFRRHPIPQTKLFRIKKVPSTRISIFNKLKKPVKSEYKIHVPSAAH